MARPACAVTIAYDSMNQKDREVFRTLIMDAGYTGGLLSEILRRAGHDVDRMAVHHFRRKLRSGKATL